MSVPNGRRPNQSPGASDEALWIVGFRLEPGRAEPDLYTVMACNGNDRPLTTSDGRIVLFGRLELTPRALALGYDSAFQRLPPPAAEASLICDLPESMRMLQEENYDPAATILELLNVLLDLVKASQWPMPEQYRRVLKAIADHLTFNREYGYFISSESVGRDAAVAAVLWSIGAVVTRSIMVQ